MDDEPVLRSNHSTIDHPLTMDDKQMRHFSDKPANLLIRTFVLLAALTSLPAAAADLEPGASTVVDLNAWDPGNGATLSLGPGDYTFVPVAGAHTAWRAWGYVLGCDADGMSCQTGWITSFRIQPALDAEIQYYSATYANAELALSNASNDLALENGNVTDLCLTEEQDVKTLIKDSVYGDNSGGLSVKITRLNDRCEALDSDDDGIDDDDDECPDSPEGAVTDDVGCAIADYCPCDGDWKNHGQYVRCVGNTAKDFLDAGLLDDLEIGSIISQAAQSSCGKG